MSDNHDTITALARLEEAERENQKLRSERLLAEHARDEAQREASAARDLAAIAKRARDDMARDLSAANKASAELATLRAQLASAEARGEQAARDGIAHYKRAEAAEARVKRLEGLNCELQTIIDNDGYPSRADYEKLEARLRAVTEAGDAMYQHEDDHGCRRAWEAARSADLPPHPDTARLDWLQAHISNVDPVSFWRGTWGAAAGDRAGSAVYEVIQTDCDLVFDASPKRGPDAYLPTIGEGSTLRAAIDAARAQAGKEAS